MALFCILLCVLFLFFTRAYFVIGLWALKLAHKSIGFELNWIIIIRLYDKIFSSWNNTTTNNSIENNELWKLGSGSGLIWGANLALPG
jgi:cytochrome b561